MVVHGMNGYANGDESKLGGGGTSANGATAAGSASANGVGSLGNGGVSVSALPPWKVGPSGGDHRFGDSLLMGAVADMVKAEGRDAAAPGSAASSSPFGSESVHFAQQAGNGGPSSAYALGDGEADAEAGGEVGTADGSGELVEKVTVNFETLLFAVQEGDTFLVQTWLAAPGVSERAPEVLNKNPALINRAVFAANSVMVALLLDAKADPDAAQRLPQGPFAGESWPLRLAVQHGSTEICKLLLEHGARLEPPSARFASRPMGIHAGDDEALLGAAAFKGFAEIAELLLDYHADVDVSI